MIFLSNKKVSRLKVNVVWLALAFCLIWGCAPQPARLTDPTAPPAGYQRRLVVVLENQSFQPIAGAAIKVETAYPTKLISPADGQGRTNGQGALELIFEPLPQYDQKVLGGGDIIADFQITAGLTIVPAGRPAIKRVLKDQQTFARYADPLYQSLNRNPETEPTYYHIRLP